MANTNRAFDFFSSILDNVRHWSEKSSARKLEKYQVKRTKRRYAIFNDEKKHPHIYNRRIKKDMRFYRKLRLPPAKNNNYYVAGANSFFGCFYNNKCFRWFEILANWLITISFCLMVIYAIVWGMHRSTAQASLNAFTITEIVAGFGLVIGIFFKIGFSMFPSTKLFYKNLNQSTQQSRFGGAVRPRKFR